MDARDNIKLWDLAKKRVSFRWHLTSYLIVNCCLWMVWLFTESDSMAQASSIPWPLYPLIGWGIGLISHYLAAYRGMGNQAIEREYENLKKHLFS